MTTTKSAIRRVRKTRLQTEVNRIRKGKYKSVIKKMSDYVESGEINEARDFLPQFYSKLMKVAKTGVIRKETVSRKISRITQKIKKSKK